MANGKLLKTVLDQNEADLLASWAGDLSASLRLDARMSEHELRAECRDFLRLFAEAIRADAGDDVNAPAWAGTVAMLSRTAATRAERGFTPAQTATFIFSLKKPLFGALRNAAGNDAQVLADEVWTATKLLDSLGLVTMEAALKSREEVITRQQTEMLELSTPVVKLWDGILALPMIGTLDSGRTQIVMETLLQRIVETTSEVVIIDITGVPTVDTLVAQHLLKTVSAARLMGVECIISGIRPQIAQTIVHLQVDLGNVITKASLADAFEVALQKRGLSLARAARG